MSNTLTIKQKIEGKEVTLDLVQTEVASAISICEKNGTEQVIVMKKGKGGALFFIDENRAAACQDRHDFPLSFLVKLSELKKFTPSAEPEKKTDPRDTAIASLKEEVETLREDADPKKLEDKDTEIELLKEEIDKLDKLNETQAADLKGAGEENAKLIAEIETLKNPAEKK